MDVMRAPFKAVGSSIAGMVGPLIAKTAATFAATAAEVGFAGALWATAGAVWAATWPILAVVAGVAALALGGYMLIKHWDAVSAFFVNLWNKITGAFSAAFDWSKNKLAGGVRLGFGRGRGFFALRWNPRAHHQTLGHHSGVFCEVVDTGYRMGCFHVGRDKKLFRLPVE
jgi:hypothetical protein